MNKNILHTGAQNFINENLNTDIMSVLLKPSPFDAISPQELAQQIEAKKKCKEKLPTYYNTTTIYYPNKLHIEQTSSEITAQYKSTLVSGKVLLDLTGGMGVDSYLFSKKMGTVFHCELDENLSEIAAHNFTVLDAKNIHTFPKNGFDFLKEIPQQFDWIYIDPSRRDEVKRRVFLLKECLPNIPENLKFLFSKTNQILVKTAPLLDITMGIKELENVKEIHIVSVRNEVKELLWILEKEYVGSIVIKTIDFTATGISTFDFNLCDEKNALVELSLPLTYLYEPNAAILKSGAFKSIGKRFQLKKLHDHTHLYTSDLKTGFPGRVFKIEEVIPYNKKNLTKFKNSKANVTTRNFPEPVASIRKKFTINDGGDRYLFFVKNRNEQHIVLNCCKTT